MIDIQPDKRSAAVTMWLIVIIAMVCAMVLLGGITRLTQSGLSMVNWHPIMGIVPPLTPAAWEEAFAAYKAFPEYKTLNYGMVLADFKSIFLMEYAHRVWGRLIGIAFILPFLWFTLRGQVRGRTALKLFGILILGGAQGVMGWLMVKSGLVEDPSVSAYRLAAHLGLAVLIAALLLRMVLSRTLLPEANDDIPRSLLHQPIRVTLTLLLITMCSGAFIAGLDAGMTFNTFPLMDGQLVPDGLFALDPLWRNPFENITMVQFEHRLLATLTVISAIWLWTRARKIRLPARTGLAVNLILLMSLVQPGLGIATLLMVVPVSLAAMHQMGALILTGLLIWLHHELSERSSRLD